MNDRCVMSVKMWYAGVGLLTATITVAVGLLVASVLGANDPRPMGVLVMDDHLGINRWQITSNDDTRAQASVSPEGQYQVTIQAGTGQILGIAPYEVHPPCTIELSITQVSGQEDVGHGLWWGTQQAPDDLLGLTGNGYFAMLPADPVASPKRDWQLFPHVRPLGQKNVLRADVTRESIIVRINDEVAGQIESVRSGWLAVGFFVRASLHGDVTIQFSSFRVWQETLSVR